MAGLAIITEACIGVKHLACVDVCPVQCVDEFVAATNRLISELEASSGIVETAHLPWTGRARPPETRQARPAEPCGSPGVCGSRRARSRRTAAPTASVSTPVAIAVGGSEAINTRQPTRPTIAIGRGHRRSCGASLSAAALVMA
jgi:NAD-dependent dihydropyrimidine dehydrogenase PreA subunit